MWFSSNSDNKSSIINIGFLLVCSSINFISKFFSHKITVFVSHLDAKSTKSVFQSKIKLKSSLCGQILVVFKIISFCKFSSKYFLILFSISSSEELEKFIFEI